jgi:TRAP-type C4-dicarboxylate transport system substrate-binding protein
LLADPGLDALARLLGAQPVSGAPARVALGDGRAQAVFAAADVAARDRAWDYASHYLHAPAWFPVHLVAVNRGALAALAGAQRDAVLNAADAAAAMAWAQAERDTEEAVQKLRDYGLKTAPAPVNMLIQLEAIGRELLFQWSEGAGEAGAELVESYYAIR